MCLTLSDIANLVTIISPVVRNVRYKMELSKFLNEKKIEKKTKHSENSLSCEREIEDSIQNLHLTTINRCSQDKHIQAQNRVILAIKKFIDELSLIEKDYIIPEILTKLMEILESDLKKTYSAPHIKSCAVLSEVDSLKNSSWFDDKKIDLKKLENIRNTLLDIYHNPEKPLKK